MGIPFEQGVMRRADGWEEYQQNEIAPRQLPQQRRREWGQQYD